MMRKSFTHTHTDAHTRTQVWRAALTWGIRCTQSLSLSHTHTHSLTHTYTQSFLFFICTLCHSLSLALWFSFASQLSKHYVQYLNLKRYASNRPCYMLRIMTQKPGMGFSVSYKTKQDAAWDCSICLLVLPSKEPLGRLNNCKQSKQRQVIYAFRNWWS